MSLPDMSSIYAEYRPKVLGYIHARLNVSTDAEDLCQDVFAKVHLKLDSFDPAKASLSTWIYSITRNSVIDYYRRSHPASELDENLAEESSVDDGLLREETLEALAAALMSLSDELREIVVLRYYDGLPLTEVGKKMGLSYGAVKLRHAKALDQLRRIMG